MFLIVGLGNPGKKYEKTKHNVGFETIDYLSSMHGIKVNKIKHHSLIGEGNIEGHKVVLLKPQTFMNLSGDAVRDAINFYKQDLEKLIIIYDDVDTEIGRIRIKKKGSAGSHNGMKSIIGNIQSSEFPRIRIGIGSNNNSDLADYVLSGFKKENREQMGISIERAAKAVTCLIKEGIDLAMNEYNVWENNEDKSK
ncbi:MAG: aminoacyl-tRNA hydrolase [Eubacteriales bacterium]